MQKVYSKPLSYNQQQIILAISLYIYAQKSIFLHLAHKHFIQYQHIYQVEPSENIMPGRVVRLKSRPSVSTLANAFMSQGRPPVESTDHTAHDSQQWDQTQYLPSHYIYDQELVLEPKPQLITPRTPTREFNGVPTPQMTPPQESIDGELIHPIMDCHDGIPDEIPNAIPVQSVQTNIVENGVYNLVSHQTKLMMFWEDKLKWQWQENNAIRLELEHLRRERENDRALIATLNGKIEKLTLGSNALIRLQKKHSIETKFKFENLTQKIDNVTATIDTLQKIERNQEDENVNAKSKEHEISATTERHSKVPNLEGKGEIVPMTSMELEHYLKAESTATCESQKAQEQQDKDRELIEFLNNNMERMIRARERDHMKQDEVMDRV